MSGTKETLVTRMRDFLFEHANLADEEKKILTEFGKKSPNRRDMKIVQQRLAEKGYDRGQLEVLNLLEHLLPEQYPKVLGVGCWLFFSVVLIISVSGRGVGRSIDHGRSLDAH